MMKKNRNSVSGDFYQFIIETCKQEYEGICKPKGYGGFYPKKESVSTRVHYLKICNQCIEFGIFSVPVSF